MQKLSEKYNKMTSIYLFIIRNTVILHDTFDAIELRLKI